MKIKRKIVVLCALCLFAHAAGATEIIPDVSLSAEKNNSKKSTRLSSQTTAFQQKELAQSPATNLSELLQQEQSTIRLTNNSGDASQTALSIRGFGDNAGQNTLILVDGFPLMNESLLSPNFNSIPLTDIERIDIYQGSKGTLYGNQAIGGVMSITTRHPEKLFADGVFTVGSYHTLYTNILAADKFKHGIFIKAFGVLAQSANFRQHNATSGNNIALQTGVDDAAGTTWVNVQSYQVTTNFPGGLTLEQMQQHPTMAVDFNNYSHYRTNLLQLLNKHILSDDWLLETRLSQQVIHGDGNIFFHYTSEDSVMNFNPRLTGHVRGIKMIFGYDGEKDQYQLSNIRIQTHPSALQNDIYAQFTLTIINKLDFMLGARRSWQDNTNPDTFNQVLVSEQGLEYHPNKDLSFYLRRDGNFRFPKATEQSSAQLANARLFAQTGVSYETGMNWHVNQSDFQLNLYQLHLHNEIAFNPQQTVQQPFGAWSNLNQTQRDGITVADTYHVNQQLQLDAQFNYVRARFLGGEYANKSIPAVPSITGNAGIHYQLHDNWQLKYFLTYTGTRYASDDVNNIGTRLPSYWLHNAALQYDKKNYILSFEITNLLNQTYAGFASYVAANNTTIYYPAAGRNYLLTLKVNIE